MNQLDVIRIKKSILNLNHYEITFKDGFFYPSAQLCEKVAKILDKDNGYVIFYGMNRLFDQYSLDLKLGLEKAYDLYEKIFNQAMAYINLDIYNVIRGKCSFAKMDVDGFNVNQYFFHIFF